MLKIPTMDDWYALARRYPQFMRVTDMTLKNYGYMGCIEFVEQTFGDHGKDIRILEFGHGFSATIMERFQSKHEVWGADRDQSLRYFAGFDWETRFASDVASRCGDVNFVRKLLTSQTP